MSRLLIRNLRKHSEKIATIKGVQDWDKLQEKYNIFPKNIPFFKKMIYDYEIIGSGIKGILKTNIYNIFNKLESVYINKSQDIVAYQEILHLHINGLNADKRNVNLDRDFSKIKFILGLGFNDLTLVNNSSLLYEEGINKLFLLSFAKYDLNAWDVYKKNKDIMFSQIEITDNDLFLYCINKENFQIPNNIKVILDMKIKDNTLTLDSNVIANLLMPKKAIQNNYGLFSLEKYINFKTVLLKQDRFQLKGLNYYIKTNIEDEKQFNLFSVAKLIHAQEYFVKMILDNKTNPINPIKTNELRQKLVDNLSSFEYDWQIDNFNELIEIKKQSKLNPNEQKIIEEVNIILNKVIIEKEMNKVNNINIKKSVRKKV